MHVSRIAKETSRLTDTVPPLSRSTRLQARSFAQSLSTYVANGGSVTKIQEEVESGDDSSELSSAGSTFSVDIENLPTSLTGAKKRKRDADPAPLTAVSIRTTTARKTSRKAYSKSNVRDESNTMNSRKQPAKKSINHDGQVEIHAPPRWEEIYDAVTEMRKKILAPVDTMGCETLAEEHASPRVCSRTTRHTIPEERH